MGTNPPSPGNRGPRTRAGHPPIPPHQARSHSSMETPGTVFPTRGQIRTTIGVGGEHFFIYEDLILPSIRTINYIPIFSRPPIQHIPREGKSKNSVHSQSRTQAFKNGFTPCADIPESYRTRHGVILVIRKVYKQM